MSAIRRRFSQESKDELCHEVITTSEATTSMAEEYGVGSAILRNWLKKYRTEHAPEDAEGGLPPDEACLNSLDTFRLTPAPGTLTLAQRHNPSGVRHPEITHARGQNRESPRPFPSTRGERSERISDALDEIRRILLYIISVIGVEVGRVETDERTRPPAYGCLAQATTGCTVRKEVTELVPSGSSPRISRAISRLMRDSCGQCHLRMPRRLSFLRGVHRAPPRHPDMLGRATPASVMFRRTHW